MESLKLYIIYSTLCFKKIKKVYNTDDIKYLGRLKKMERGEMEKQPPS